jgi:hypothetical protein
MAQLQDDLPELSSNRAQLRRFVRREVLRSTSTMFIR